MKTVPRFIYAILAVMILSACAKMDTQCATPTLTPPSGSGPAGQDVRVKIETTTQGAYLSWTDDGTPPTPTGPHIIKAQSGYAITVFGRTLTAIAFKTGLTDSPVVRGVYSVQ